MPVVVSFAYICDHCNAQASPDEAFSIVPHMTLPQPKCTSYASIHVLCAICNQDLEDTLRDLREKRRALPV